MIFYLPPVYQKKNPLFENIESVIKTELLTFDMFHKIQALASYRSTWRAAAGRLKLNKSLEHRFPHDVRSCGLLDFFQSLL